MLRSIADSDEASLNRFPLFLLLVRGTREKAKQKVNAVKEFRGLRAATQGSALRIRNFSRKIE